MLTIEEKRKRDKQVCKEARIKIFARLIGYNEIGEPVEIAYDPEDGEYAFHVAGERVREASDEIVAQFIP